MWNTKLRSTVSIPQKELSVSQKLQIRGYITVKDGYIVKFFSYTITSVLKTTSFQLKNLILPATLSKSIMNSTGSIYLSCVYMTKDK